MAILAERHAANSGKPTSPANVLNAQIAQNATTLQTSRVPELESEIGRLKKELLEGQERGRRSSESEKKLREEVEWLRAKVENARNALRLNRRFRSP